MSKIYTTMQKQVVNDTRLARKMYPDFTDNEDGTITIEVEVVDNFTTATVELMRKTIDSMYATVAISPSEIIVNPRQYAELQKLIEPDDMDIKVSNYCPDGAIMCIKGKK